MTYLYKILYLLPLLILNNSSIKSQTYWRQREDSLWAVLYEKSPDSANKAINYKKFLEESGSLGSGLRVWFKEQTKITDSLLLSLKISKRKKLTLLIPENYKSFENGEEHIKIYLLNFTTKTLSIPRIDATLDSISEYIKINDKWLQLRKNSRSMCGNSYYKKSMPPGQSNLFETFSINENNGTELLKYKLVFNYFGQKVESNEIEIKLFSNQLKRFLAEGIERSY